MAHMGRFLSQRLLIRPSHCGNLTICGCILRRHLRGDGLPHFVATHPMGEATLTQGCFHKLGGGFLFGGPLAIRALLFGRQKVRPLMSLRTKWTIKLGTYIMSYYNPNMVYEPYIFQGSFSP